MTTKRDGRPLKFRFLDDLDRSGLPAAQRDAVRRIASHANVDGANSHPSLEQIGEELGGRSARTVHYALSGRPGRGWMPMIGTWVERVSLGRSGRASVYRLMDAPERAEALRKWREATATTGTNEPLNQHQPTQLPAPVVPICNPSEAVILSTDEPAELTLEGEEQFVAYYLAGFLLGEDPRLDPWSYRSDENFTRQVDEAARQYVELHSGTLPQLPAEYS